jgi:iron complex outermembrane receptor protein
MGDYSRGTYNRWLASSAAIVCMAVATPAMAQTRTFDVPAQDASRAIPAFAKQAGIQLLANVRDVRGKKTRAVRGAYSVQEALQMLLQDSGLEAAPDTGTGIVTIRIAPRATGEAIAGSAAADNDGSADIVVTGTNIRGQAPIGSSIISIDREKIEKSGFSSVEQLTESLPQNFGNVSSDQTIGGVGNVGDPSNLSTGSGVNLRGLGTSSTLVLLNGRRLAPSGLGEFVDISVLPLTAVQRVEVLPDGASAIYGSDAVGGVINFILNDRFDGFESRVRYGGVTEGGLREFRVGQTAGTVWSTGSALLSYEHLNRTSLDANDRGFAAPLPDPTDLTPNEGRDSVVFSGKQSVTGGLQVFSDVIYSHRRADQASFSFAPRLIKTATDFLSANVGLAISPGKNWNGTLSASYSNTQNDGTQLIGTAVTDLVDYGLNSQGLEGTVNGALFDIPGGPVRIAIGAAYRRESISSSVDPKKSRNITSAYGEVTIPIFSHENRLPGIEGLVLSAAARYEKYSDFGDTLNPKIGINWVPVHGLTIRGNFNKSFRAPLLSEQQDRVIPILFNFPDSTAADGTTLSILLQGNNARLKPERATSWSVGADFSPPSDQNLKLGFTLFNTRYTDRIAVPAPGAAVFGVYGQSAIYEPILDRSHNAGRINALILSPLFIDAYGQSYSTSEITVIDNTLTNIGTSEVRGLDIGGTYSLNTSIGRVGIDLNATYLFYLRSGITSSAPQLDVSNTAFRPTKLRARLNGSWSKGPWASNFAINFAGGYENALVTPNVDISPRATIDVQVSYSTGENTGSILKNVTISASALNVFDTAPPFVSVPSLSNSAGYDPANASPLGRFLAIEIRKKW